MQFEEHAKQLQLMPFFLFLIQFWFDLAQHSGSDLLLNISLIFLQALSYKTKKSREKQKTNSHPIHISGTLVEPTLKEAYPREQLRNSTPECVQRNTYGNHLRLPPYVYTGNTKMNDILATEGSFKQVIDLDALLSYLSCRVKVKHSIGGKVVLFLPSRKGRDPVLEVRVISRISAHFRMRFRTPDSSVLTHLDGVFTVLLFLYFRWYVWQQLRLFQLGLGVRH